MENERSKRADKFFAGKGFYIVLALCIAVIGVSAISIALNSDNGKAPNLDPGMTLENPTEAPSAPPVSSAKPTQKVDVEAGEGTVVKTWKSDEKYEQPVAWVWPVRGEIEREYAVETLAYDVTMKDWRTHDGIDILADKGAVVRAASGGKVESIKQDDLYGTTVTIDHGNGLKSTYSNLADKPTVKEGDSVNAGDVIGSVGTTALCEVGQGSHVHIAMSKDGNSVDPTKYLPA